MTDFKARTGRKKKQFKFIRYTQPNIRVNLWMNDAQTARQQPVNQKRVSGQELERRGKSGAGWGSVLD